MSGAASEPGLRIVRIVWLTFWSWSFCDSFYGVIIYIMWLILYVLVWHVFELVFSWLYERIRESNYDYLYRFRELKRWKYNKRVSVSYMAPNVGQWSPLNDKGEPEATKRQGLNKADDFELLKAIRGGQRGVATKLITEAEEILESTFLLTQDYERFFVIYHN